jgi:hypothetical protein
MKNKKVWLLKDVNNKTIICLNTSSKEDEINMFKEVNYVNNHINTEEKSYANRPWTLEAIKCEFI